MVYHYADTKVWFPTYFLLYTHLFSHYYNDKRFMTSKFLSRQLETFWETVHTICLHAV